MKPSHFILSLFCFASFASFGQRDRVAFNEMPVIKANHVMPAPPAPPEQGLIIRDDGRFNTTEYIIDGVTYVLDSRYAGFNFYNYSFPEEIYQVDGVIKFPSYVVYDYDFLLTDHAPLFPIDIIKMPEYPQTTDFAFDKNFKPASEE